MEDDLNAWLKRANQFGAKVDVNIKGILKFKKTSPT